MVTLLLNTWVWQRQSPTWWTGKIGDIAWLFFAPFLVAWLLALLAPAKWAEQKRLMGLTALILTGLTFSLLKTIPFINAAVVETMIRWGYPLKLRLDPTDLWTLPSLLAAWSLWRRSVLTLPSTWLRRVAPVAAVLVILADAGAPQMKGFTCLVEKDNTLFGLREVVYPAEFGSPREEQTAYRSEDGGLTWRLDAEFPSKEAVCRPVQHSVSDPTNKDVQFFFLAAEGIYRTDDRGETLHLEKRIKADVYGFVVHKPTGNIVVAVGTDGMLIRTPAGEWRQTLAAE
jgi:hypothetical protein